MTALRWIGGITVTLLAVWLCCAVLAYGLFLGYWQGAYPAHAQVLCATDKTGAWRVARWGPFGLRAIVGVMLVDHDAWHGLQWTCQEENNGL